MNHLTTCRSGGLVKRTACVLAACILLALTSTAVAQKQTPQQASGQHAKAAQPGVAPVGGPVVDRYIVVFRDNVVNPRGLASALARAHGFTVGHFYEHAIKGFAADMPGASARRLTAHASVAYVEQDQYVGTFAQTLPTGVRRIFADQNPEITINGNDNYRIDVDVAVIDTGIDLDHPDLNVVAGVDCTIESGGGPPWARTVSCEPGGDDGNGHGTHVAGTIAAVDNGFGVVGVAPGARLWAVRVLDNNGSGKISWVVAGIDYVTANASQIKVANMSLGCECSSQALDDAITKSVAAGVTYAVAAGNSNKDAATFSPANHPDVITVSALADFDGEPGGLGLPTCRTDEDDTLANFSNWGSMVEVAAPGVCILSTWKNGGYNTISGTSMASPHVAGAAALLAASGMSDPANIRDTIASNGNFNWTDDSGDGIQEPLLDVGNQAVFNPTTVAGDGGSTDGSPSVSITSPSEGATVSGTITVSADANDDYGVTQVEFFVDGSSIGVDTNGTDGWSVSWNTTSHGDGGHTVSATATDTASQTSSNSVNVTVNNGGGSDSTTVSVSAIDYSTDGGKNGDKHLYDTVSVLDGNGLPVSGASVSIRLDNLSTGEFWLGSATTGSAGTVRFDLKNAPSGCYTTAVTELNGNTDPDWPSNMYTLRMPSCP